MSVRLQLLGTPVLLGPGGGVPFRRELRFRLLAYLALQRRAVDRDHLAFVFWPDQSDEAARRNLRKTWFNLRRLAPLSGGAGLAGTPQTLEWTGATDLSEWHACVDGGRLREAAERYSGALLQGLDGGGDEFQRWLDGERERVARRFRDVVVALLPTLAPADGPAALGWLDRLLALDPLDETAVRAQVRLLADCGRSAQARRVHQRWRSRLRDELGVAAPDDIESLLAGAATPPAVATAPTAPPRGAPAYLTSFVGRDRELAAIAGHFAAGARLVSVVGPPGCGKTRLAAETLRRLPRHAAARRAFVELDRLPAQGNVREFVMHVATALGLALREHEWSLERLCDFLAQGDTLLVLDNLEHRLADVPALLRLLEVPGLRVLATTRARTGAAGEVLIELGGLQIYGVDGSADEALALFEARCARRLDAGARAAARRLCGLLEGQPLAIELAAGHCRLLPPAELARRVAADLDALSGDDPGRPSRHRSLRAAFEASWRLLTPALQQALARLSVLRADFSRDAAAAVAGVGDAALAALADHSLLRPDATADRLRWHPFVREHALARLASEPAAVAALQDRHCTHFAHLMQRLDLREEHPPATALQAAAREALHLADAWRHAVATQRCELWETLAEALSLHFEIHARYREGSELLGLCALPPAGAVAARSERAAARVTVHRARLLHWAENAAADELAAAALAVFERLDDDAGRIAAWRVRAVVAWRRGRIDDAVSLFERALALGDRSGQRGKRAILLDGLGLALLHRGDADGSRAAFEEALELNERHDNPLQRVHNLINLALDARVRAPPQAMALARRALALAQEIGFVHYVPHGLTTQALAALAAGDAAGADELAARAAALTRASGDTYVEAWALTARARAALALGDDGAAAMAIARGLELSWADHDLGLLSQHLALTAQWLCRQGRVAPAATIVASLLALPTTPRWLALELDGPLGEGTRGADAPVVTLALLWHRALGELDAARGSAVVAAPAN